MTTDSPILSAYRALLEEVDAWFAACLQAGGSRLACRRGCHACCRGLFDISALDARLLQDGFSRLPDETRDTILARCRPIRDGLLRRWPTLRPPYWLNDLPEAEWTAMPEDDPTLCPLLDADGLCLVYDSRPLVCRLHGLPNLDCSGEDFEGTVCTLHAAEPHQAVPDDVLRWRFRDAFLAEAELLAALVAAEDEAGCDTFIPLALLAVEGPATPPSR